MCTYPITVAFSCQKTIQKREGYPSKRSSSPPKGPALRNTDAQEKLAAAPANLKVWVGGLAEGTTWNFGLFSENMTGGGFEDATNGAKDLATRSKDAIRGSWPYC